MHSTIWKGPGCDFFLICMVCLYCNQGIFVTWVCNVTHPMKITHGVLDLLTDDKSWFIHLYCLNNKLFRKTKHRSQKRKNERLQLIIYLLRLLWPVMLSRHHNKVNTPLLNWIPWLILTDNRHAEVGLICDSTFATWIWGPIHRSRLCIIPEEDIIIHGQWWRISQCKYTAQIALAV